MYNYENERLAIFLKQGQGNNMIHIVKKLKSSYKVNKIGNLTHLKVTSPLSIKNALPYISKAILKR